ncbi:FAD-dependent oxidoreductase [Paenibacillus anaericanus]|uniref:FAD-dependent oxidoreductase n=1 Tax=Paenibacillus anaericanus TaxID=170367 RepID=A0A433Y185_9BACL|nr:FAD-dependent oxidoreductase [Paenibacillus anaericanus]RUT41413.1 FAD-dependent oxidoreductase [Paenibacillus anaericanus]
MMEEDKYHAKIGIIGAGISGVTTAYQLAKKGYTNITILEKDERVGGKCHSIEYRGKTYEMGTLIGLPSYKHTMELMAEFDLMDKGPLLERGFFDAKGRKMSQIPLDQVAEFMEEFRRLPEVLSRYESLKEPGFLHLPPELCQPFSAWCEENDLSVIMQVYMHYFSTFGFGSIYDVPAAYVLKFLSYDNLMAFIEITHMITWPKGVNQLIQRMADQVEDLRLTCEVHHMEKVADGRVRVETGQDILYFDKVIYTASLHHMGHIVDLSPADKGLFDSIIYERFRVYAYRVEGIPAHSGYIPHNMYPERKGHMMAWYYRWADLGATDLVTVYVAENEQMTDVQMRETVENKLRELGGENIRLYMMKSWKQFPHVDSNALRNGFYERIDQMQGRDQIYYAGEIMNFPTLENCIVYAKHLVNRFF